MNKFAILGITAILVLVAGFFLLSQNTTEDRVNITTDISEEATSTPTSTPVSDIDSEAEEASVILTNSGFEPRTLRIKVGTKVIWTNNTTGIATVDSNIHPTHRLYPFLNLGNFGPEEVHSVTFGDAGTYTYHNHLNSSQTGTVIVE